MINKAQCENCGASLLELSNGKLICPHCKTSYIPTNDVQNTYITNNTSNVKNFYGNVTIHGDDNTSKIDGYFNIVFEALKSGNYSRAQDFLNKIITINPNNNDAILLNDMIEKDKVYMFDFDYFFDKWLEGKKYLYSSPNFWEYIKYVMRTKYDNIYNYLSNRHSLQALVENRETANTYKNILSRYKNLLSKENNKTLQSICLVIDREMNVFDQYLQRDEIKYLDQNIKKYNQRKEESRIKQEKSTAKKRMALSLVFVIVLLGSIIWLTNYKGKGIMEAIMVLIDCVLLVSFVFMLISSIITLVKLKKDNDD